MSAEHLDCSMVIEWSPLDDAYLVTLPDWAESVTQPVTHGATHEEAARNGREVLEMLLESAREESETIPAPRTRATMTP
jgi:predicted RNase H-like HicB family nuclease